MSSGYPDQPVVQPLKRPVPLREGALPDWPGARIPPSLPPLPA